MLWLRRNRTDAPSALLAWVHQNLSLKTNLVLVLDCQGNKSPKLLQFLRHARIQQRLISLARAHST
jgi:hypothetical protein